jgi:hypothetical protein
MTSSSTQLAPELVIVLRQIGKKARVYPDNVIVVFCPRLVPALIGVLSSDMGLLAPTIRPWLAREPQRQLRQASFSCLSLSSSCRSRPPMIVFNAVLSSEAL